MFHNFVCLFFLVHQESSATIDRKLWEKVQSIEASGHTVLSDNFSYLEQKTVTEKYVWLADRTAMSMVAQANPGLVVVPVNFVSEPYSVALQKGSAYAEDIDKL